MWELRLVCKMQKDSLFVLKKYVSVKLPKERKRRRRRSDSHRRDEVNS